MLFRRAALLLSLLALTGSCASPPKAPTLTLVITVDQMRADYLERFAPRYEAGLRRLIDDGVVWQQARYQHNTTWTASGHATIATGSYPRRHGIVGNSWWERGEGRRVGCVDGNHAQRMRAPALGDLLVEQHPEARVWSIAIKDRSALLPAGQKAAGSIWLDRATSSFVTDLDALPSWAQRVVETQRWEPLGPTQFSREDAFLGETEPNVFPHIDLSVRASPAGDDAVLELALAAIHQEQLGQREVRDLLWIGLSAADGIGHLFGPQSQEVEDYYVRLDRTLGSLFDQLDQRLGADGWNVVLTSDHGVVPLPEQSVADGIDAARRRYPAMIDDARAALARAAASTGITTDQIEVRVANGWILYDPAATVATEDWPALRAAFAAELQRNDPRILDSYTYDELGADEVDDRPFLELYRNGFDAERTADVQVRGVEFDLLFASETGTSHGSVYDYDRHVPVVFMGASFTNGTDREDRAVADLAPTLAHCWGIELTVPVDGVAVPEACRQR